MSIKEIFELIKTYIGIVWSKKVWVLIFFILGAFVNGIRAYIRPDVYRAKLTFIVNEEESGGNGLGAIIGQFGLGRSSSSSNYDKIVDISKSNRIIEGVLFESVIINNEDDLIANHIIKLYNYHESWQGTDLEGFLYNKDLKDSKNDLVTNRLTKKLVQVLAGTDNKSVIPLMTINYDDKSTFLSILSETNNPELSVLLAKSWYSQILTFYVNNAIEPQKKTLEELTVKVDSIYSLLIGSETKLAKGTDKMGLIKAIDNLPIAQQSRNMQMYAAMYAEVIKNKETTEFILRGKTPYFQSIDTPYLPLRMVYKPGLIISGILGGILVAIVGVIIIISFSYVNEKLNE